MSDSGATIETDAPPTYARTPRALIRDPEVSMQAKALWTILEDFASPERPEPFPGQKLLGELTGVSVATIRRWLTELQETGWITVRHEVTQHGRRNHYRLCWRPCPTSHRSSASEGVRSSMSGADRSPASAEEEPVEEEPSEVKPTSQSDLQRELAERQRDERNRNVDPRQKTSDWNKVLKCANEGRHRWSEHLHLSAIARAAASEVAVTIKFGTVSEGRVAFYAAWDAIAAQGLTPMRDSVA